MTKWIGDRVLELIYTGWDVQDFAQEMGLSGPPFIWDVNRRFVLCCELDSAFFHLYDIEPEDIEYIMDSFNIVKKQDEDKYSEYKTKNSILEIYSNMKQAIDTNEPFKTTLNPLPADQNLTHQPKG